jgi:hypothetical protein
MTFRRCGTVAAVLLGTIISSGARGADNAAQEASNKLAHDIYKQLIEINTTDSVGNVTSAAEAMAKRLRDAGFAPADMVLLGPTDTRKNLVVRLRGTGAGCRGSPARGLGHGSVPARGEGRILLWSRHA